MAELAIGITDCRRRTGTESERPSPLDSWEARIGKRLDAETDRMKTAIIIPIVEDLQQWHSSDDTRERWKAYGGEMKALLTVEKSAIPYLRVSVQSKKIYQVNAVSLQEKTVFYRNNRIFLNPRDWLR